jgi:mRNA interferase MazF
MTSAGIKRGEVWWVSLDPTQGPEIKKTRPCLVLSANILNRLRKTVVVIPMSTIAKPHPPITVPLTCQGRSAVAIIDQIRAVGKHRLKTKIETISHQEMASVVRAVSEILEL